MDNYSPRISFRVGILRLRRGVFFFTKKASEIKRFNMSITYQSMGMLRCGKGKKGVKEFIMHLGHDAISWVLPPAERLALLRLDVAQGIR